MTIALRDGRDRHLFDVIGKGYGIMYPFADRIAPADRWAIVSYVRALQLSRHCAAGAVAAAPRARSSAAAP